MLTYINLILALPWPRFRDMGDPLENRITPVLKINYQSKKGKNSNTTHDRAVDLYNCSVVFLHSS